MVVALILLAGALHWQAFLSFPPGLQTLLQQTAVLKLNGGLGTSMGLEKAKSLLPVKDGKTFLDLIAEQIVYTRENFGSNVRFILMNR